MSGERRKIKARIAPDGNVTIQPVGFTGSSCEEATRDIEAAIGKVEAREHTSEYYERDPEEKVKA